MTIANITGVIGASNDSTSSTALFPLGTVVVFGNTSYTYAQAATALAAAGTTNLTAGFATTTGTNYTHDVPAPGVPAGHYFWAKKVASPF